MYCKKVKITIYYKGIKNNICRVIRYDSANYKDFWEQYYLSEPMTILGCLLGITFAIEG